MSISGERWEGNSLNGLPFGYGCVYNSENQLIYEGFMFNGMKMNSMEIAILWHILVDFIRIWGMDMDYYMTRRKSWYMKGDG